MFRVAILQYPIIWADKEANLRAAVRRIKRIKGKADLALLPEMFTTGFCTDRPELAETIDGRTIQVLQQTADLMKYILRSEIILQQFPETCPVEDKVPEADEPDLDDQPGDQIVYRSSPIGHYLRGTEQGALKRGCTGIDDGSPGLAHDGIAPPGNHPDIFPSIKVS